MNKAPTRDGRSFATASSWYGRRGVRHDHSVLVVEQIVIDRHLVRHFQWFWHAARLAPLRRLLRLHWWGYQLRFLRRLGRLDQLLGARGEGEAVGLGEPDHGLELLRRDDDVGLVPP